jgi:hypothetical protein
MSYRPLAVAAAVTALSVMHITSTAAQSVYVAPGGVYIGAGAGPVYLTPGAPTNGAAAYVAPGYDYGYGAAAYQEPSYGYGYGAAAYVEPRCDCGYGAAAYQEPSYGYGYGAAYVAPRYGYGYGPAVPHRRYYSGARSAYAAALPLRPRMAVPYRAGRAIRR